MVGYVYDIETSEVVARITGDTNQAIESEVVRRYGDSGYGMTYTPAFGAEGGLIDCADAEDVAAK